MNPIRRNRGDLGLMKQWPTMGWQVWGDITQHSVMSDEFEQRVVAMMLSWV